MSNETISSLHRLTIVSGIAAIDTGNLSYLLSAQFTYTSQNTEVYLTTESLVKGMLTHEVAIMIQKTPQNIKNRVTRRIAACQKKAIIRESYDIL